MDKMRCKPIGEVLNKAMATQISHGSRGWFSSLRRLPGLALQLLTLLMALNFLAFAPWAVHAQSALLPTQIVVGAPAHPDHGGPLTVQAVLADSQGHPISKAVIYFTTHASFLKSTSDIVLAQAVTNANGQAVAQIANDFSGTITLRAEFRGDGQYASSNATVDTGPAGQAQVYVEHVGVDLPGFNVPPLPGATRASVQAPQSSVARFVQSLWPAMNAWPLAAVLLIVWSLYLFAITFLFRVAALGHEGDDSASTGARSSF